MHTQRITAPAYGSAHHSQDTVGNAELHRDSLANTVRRLDPDLGEEYLQLVGSTDSWSFLSEKQNISEERTGATTGTHRYFCICDLRADAFTAKLLHSTDHALEKLH